MHIHLSFLNKNGDNLCENQDFFENIVAGLLKFLMNSMIFFAPNEFSYERFRDPDFFTPQTISWGGNNRTTAIRTPDCIIKHIRMEHRVPGNDAEIEEVLIAILLAAGHGCKYKLQAPEKIFGNSFDDQYNLPKIPKDILEVRKIPKITDIIDSNFDLI